MYNNTKPKYQFHRAKWYEYEMWEPFPAGRPVNQDRVKAMLEWCKEQFGPANPITDAWARWSVSYSIIRFRDEKDYIFFMLKWA
jgi:hypothetical protein